MKSGFYSNPNKAEIEQSRLRKEKRKKDEQEKKELLERILFLESRVDELCKLIEMLSSKNL
jgi:hypothetical protein